MDPGFSERTFEFCYNAEFCSAHQALLASHPYLPTQNAEKFLGYDVEYAIASGGFSWSIFLQHKVSSFASNLAGKNAKYFGHHKGPYFRFPVDSEQHSLLVSLSATRSSVFYCAPKFRSSTDLEANWRGQTIRTSSVLLDPAKVGPIKPGAHNVTYGPNGENPALHSDTITFDRNYTIDDVLAASPRQAALTVEDVAELGRQLKTQVARITGAEQLLDDVSRRTEVEAAQILLGRVFKVSWLVLPRA